MMDKSSTLREALLDFRAVLDADIHDLENGVWGADHADHVFALRDGLSDLLDLTMDRDIILERSVWPISGI